MTDDAKAPPRLDPRAALFLDFDGTLAAIAPRPEAVVVGDWVRPALTRLQAALGGALALVSGRPLTELDALLAPLRLPAAGVHGAERRDADGRLHRLVATPPAQAVLRAERLVALYAGLQLERKPAALALHFRARPQLGELCAQALRSAARRHRDWTVMTGKCVVELKPAAASKAVAVRAFGATAAFAGRVPVFVGDDATDEDGFDAVQSAGGWGVKVGAGPSVARYRLADPPAVRAWLQDSLAAWPGATQGVAAATGGAAA
mgnify:CR=1 FL=1